MDEVARARLRPAWERLATIAESVGLTPNRLTLLGLALAVAAAVAAALGAWWWALVLWLASRIPDGVDGVLARQQGSASDLGGFLDVTADFVAYGGFVVGVAVGAPGARLACAVLLLTYYLNGTAFLTVAGLAEKRRADVATGDRSLQFVGGLTEGLETIVAHGLFALLAAKRTAWLEPAVWVFAGLVAVTFLQRVAAGVRVLRD